MVEGKLLPRPTAGRVDTALFPLHRYAVPLPACGREETGRSTACAQEEARCAALHPDDSAAWAACKKAWTDAVAAEAVGGVRGIRNA